MYKELMSYDDFKCVCTSKDLGIQYTFRQETENSDKYYELFAFDSAFRYECHLNSIDTSTGLADFEANYKSGCNDKLSQRFKFESSSNRQDVRICQVVGDLRRTFLYATLTSTGSFDQGNATDYIMTCPDSTHTYIDFFPAYSYSLTGGALTLLSNPVAPIKAAFIIAPNIPSEYGGNWPIVENKKLVSMGDTFIEKVDSKYFTYRDGMPETSRTRLHIDHVAGENVEIEFCLEMFI